MRRPVPRIGGVGIVVGVLAGALGDLAARLRRRRAGPLAAGLRHAGASWPGWPKTSPSASARARRLLFTAVSALLAVWLLDAVIARTAIPGLDWVVSFPLGAALVTVFVVAGVANSVNIIDGFNGLASMCAC